VRNTHLLQRLIGIVLLAVSISLLAVPAHAQGRAATLVGRAILPAATLADGPKAGLKALVPSKVLNGVRVPFDSQPVGTVSGIIPGDYAGTWMFLSESTFDNKQNSDDYLLRIYTVEIDLRRANSGGGSVAVLDWMTLSDPGKKLSQPIKNSNTRDRALTGQDFDPRAFQRGKDGSFWVAEAYGPSLLHFNGSGQALEAPIALGAGALQGIAITPNRATLIVGQRSAGNANVILRQFDVSKRTFGNDQITFTLDNPANSVGDLMLVSNTKLLVTEQDNQENKNAGFKKIFLVDFSNRPVSKTLLVDLLNISDPSNISTSQVFQAAQNAFGLGSTFKFPYRDISAVYPLNAQTLMVVNNNRVPYGLGRSTSQADDTDYIAVQLPQPLDLDQALRVPR
jgi:glycerophosphoryl diester phosphodiesterase